MKVKLIAIGIPTVLAAAGVFALGWWLGGLRVATVPVRLPETAAPAPTPSPGAAPTTAPSAASTVNLAGRFVRGSGAPAKLLGSWPSFRGPNLNGVSAERISLARQWGADGPRTLWSVDLGQGYAGPAVRNGRVYVLDYDEKAREDCLRCLSLADGKEIWRRAYPVEIKRNHGISRTVPAVTDNYAVTLGPKGHVLCVDAVTGAYRWGLDLVAQLGAVVPPWYAGQCPLIDGGRAILAPGGRALMIAVDCATGKIVWQTPNPNNWQMTHSSILPVTFAGKRMYVYCASGGVVGVDATDGKLLWETPEWTVKTANIPAPVTVGDGRLFLCGGYDAGAMMLQLKDEGGKIVPRTVFRVKPDVFGSSQQQTPIFYNGVLYGVIPGGQLACLDLEGHQLWTSGSAHRFGLGPYLVADGMIYVLDDNGVLTLVEATPSGYKQLAQARIILNGRESWGPLAMVGGRLLARDLTRMVCIDVVNP